jgi:hypothetical protein
MFNVNKYLNIVKFITKIKYVLIIDSVIVMKMKVEKISEILNLQAIKAFWSNSVPFAQGSN